MNSNQWMGTLLVLSCGAAHAETVVPVIDRPLTLPRASVNATIDLPYTNWAAGASGGSSLSGESLAVGADYGFADRLQLGAAAAFAIDPGAGFGSLLLSSLVALDQKSALRVDAGYERIGLNGAPQSQSGLHVNRYFGGVGVPVKVALTPTLAFVSGRTGAIHFGQFTNIGTNGTGLYSGASASTETGADVLTVSGGDNSSGTSIGINVPLGLLLQPHPLVALTLRTGYSAVVAIPGGSGNAVADHFIPVGIEGILSPIPLLDIGASFMFDGLVGVSGGGSTALPGYFDLRAVNFWVRFRGG